MDGYVVTAGYVSVETAVPGGRAEIDLPRGAALPDDVPAEQRDRLLRAGAIAAVDGGADEAEELPPPGSPPPRRGAGSSTEAWLAYAHTHSIPIADGCGRDHIIALLAAEGIPVE